MAGGQGKGRIGLVLAEWPTLHREAWEKAIANGDVFEGRGPAVHWRPATRKTNVNQYGRWLGFLQKTNRLVFDGRPEEQVTREVIGEYVDHLRRLVAPRTVVTLLVGLKVMIQAMVPAGDWRWLADTCNALNRWAKPVTDKNARMRPSQEIYGAAVAEMDRLLAQPIEGRNKLCAYRNALMVAWMAARPLRLKNFTALTMGKSLLPHGESWLICIAGEDMKKGQPLECEVPNSLLPYLHSYLQEVRPRLMIAGGASQTLWVAWEKTAITQREVYHCFVSTTRRLLGVTINPHLLRDCAATSLSLISVGAARAAAPLLGHTQFATTQRHYVRARQVEASRTINNALSTIKSAET